MSKPVVPTQFLEFVTSHQKEFIQRLADAVHYESVSAETDLSSRQIVINMGNWLHQQLKDLGVKDSDAIQLKPDQIVKDEKGQVIGTIPFPPLVVGRIGNDPNKKTILVYGHYDVQPAKKEDGWTTQNPFILEVDQVNDKMIGRGSTDDKGPVMGWLNVLDAHKALGLELPVNLRFCFEGMEESNSEHLEDFIRKDARDPKGWFYGVDGGCISDNYWLNTDWPCLTYGLRGIIAFNIKICGPGHDLHSGMYGGAVYEPMTCLVTLLSKLVTPKGHIEVPGIYDGVQDPDENEKKRYEDLHYTTADFAQAAGGDISISDNKVDILMHRSRYPSLSIHGIEGAYSGKDVKTVIPATVGGKFSIRLVPGQDSARIRGLVEFFLEREFAALDTKCSMIVECLDVGESWITDPDDWNFTAAKKATKDVYGEAKDPDLTREGGSIPVANIFADALSQDGKKASIMLLPMGRGDDGAHSTNEKMNISNYINGTKLLGSYLYHVAAGDRN